MYQLAGIYWGLPKLDPQPGTTFSVKTFAVGEEEINSGTRKASVI